MYKKRFHRKKTQKNKEIALERVEALFSEAEKIFNENRALANRYVGLARKIAMKYKVRIPRNLKRRFCKNCYKYLKPGVNLQVRTRKGKVVYCCLDCGKLMRFVYKK